MHSCLLRAGGCRAGSKRGVADISVSPRHSTHHAGPLGSTCVNPEAPLCDCTIGASVLRGDCGPALRCSHYGVRHIPAMCGVERCEPCVKVHFCDSTLSWCPLDVYVVCYFDVSRFEEKSHSESRGRRFLCLSIAPMCLCPIGLKENVLLYASFFLRNFLLYRELLNEVQRGICLSFFFVLLTTSTGR